MPYLIVEVPVDQSVTLGKLFANRVRVSDTFGIDVVSGTVIEIGHELPGNEEEE